MSKLLTTDHRVEAQERSQFCLGQISKRLLGRNRTHDSVLGLVHSTKNFHSGSLLSNVMPNPPVDFAFCHPPDLYDNSRSIAATNFFNTNFFPVDHEHPGAGTTQAIRWLRRHYGNPQQPAHILAVIDETFFHMTENAINEIFDLTNNSFIALWDIMVDHGRAAARTKFRYAGNTKETGFLQARFYDNFFVRSISESSWDVHNTMLGNFCDYGGCFNKTFTHYYSCTQLSTQGSLGFFHIRRQSIFHRPTRPLTSGVENHMNVYPGADKGYTLITNNFEAILENTADIKKQKVLYLYQQDVSIITNDSLEKVQKIRQQFPSVHGNGILAGFQDKYGFSLQLLVAHFINILPPCSWFNPKTCLRKCLDNPLYFNIAIAAFTATISLLPLPLYVTIPVTLATFSIQLLPFVIAEKDKDQKAVLQSEFFHPLLIMPAVTLTAIPMICQNGPDILKDHRDSFAQEDFSFNVGLDPIDEELYLKLLGVNTDFQKAKISYGSLRELISDVCREEGWRFFLNLLPGGSLITALHSYALFLLEISALEPGDTAAIQAKWNIHMAPIIPLLAIDFASIVSVAFPPLLILFFLAKIVVHFFMFRNHFLYNLTIITHTTQLLHEDLDYALFSEASDPLYIFTNLRKILVSTNEMTQKDARALVATVSSHHWETPSWDGVAQMIIKLWEKIKSCSNTIFTFCCDVFSSLNKIIKGTKQLFEPSVVDLNTLEPWSDSDDESSDEENSNSSESSDSSSNEDDDDPERKSSEEEEAQSRPEEESKETTEENQTKSLEEKRDDEKPKEESQAPSIPIPPAQPAEVQQSRPQNDSSTTPTIETKKPKKVKKEIEEAKSKETQNQVTMIPNKNLTFLPEKVVFTQFGTDSPLEDLLIDECFQEFEERLNKETINNLKKWKTKFDVMVKETTLRHKIQTLSAICTSRLTIFSIEAQKIPEILSKEVHIPFIPIALEGFTNTVVVEGQAGTGKTQKIMEVLATSKLVDGTKIIVPNSQLLGYYTNQNFACTIGGEAASITIVEEYYHWSTAYLENLAKNSQLLILIGNLIQFTPHYGVDEMYTGPAHANHAYKNEGKKLELFQHATLLKTCYRFNADFHHKLQTHFSLAPTDCHPNQFHSTTYFPLNKLKEIPNYTKCLYIHYNQQAKEFIANNHKEIKSISVPQSQGMNTNNYEAVVLVILRGPVFGTFEINTQMSDDEIKAECALSKLYTFLTRSQGKTYIVSDNAIWKTWDTKFVQKFQINFGDAFKHFETARRSQFKKRHPWGKWPVLAHATIDYFVHTFKTMPKTVFDFAADQGRLIEEFPGTKYVMGKNKIEGTEYIGNNFLPTALKDLKPNMDIVLIDVPINPQTFTFAQYLDTVKKVFESGTKLILVKYWCDKIEDTLVQLEGFPIHTFFITGNSTEFFLLLTKYELRAVTQSDLLDNVVSCQGSAKNPTHSIAANQKFCGIHNAPFLKHISVYPQPEPSVRVAAWNAAFDALTKNIVAARGTKVTTASKFDQIDTTFCPMFGFHKEYNVAKKLLQGQDLENYCTFFEIKKAILEKFSVNKPIITVPRDSSTLLQNKRPLPKKNLEKKSKDIQPKETPKPTPLPKKAAPGKGAITTQMNPAENATQNKETSPKENDKKEETQVKSEAPLFTYPPLANPPFDEEEEKKKENFQQLTFPLFDPNPDDPIIPIVLPDPTTQTTTTTSTILTQERSSQLKCTLKDDPVHMGYLRTFLGLNQRIVASVHTPSPQALSYTTRPLFLPEEKPLTAENFHGNTHTRAVTLMRLPYTPVAWCRHMVNDLQGLAKRLLSTQTFDPQFAQFIAQIPADAFFNQWKISRHILPEDLTLFEDWARKHDSNKSRSFYRALARDKGKNALNGKVMVKWDESLMSFTTHQKDKQARCLINPDKGHLALFGALGQTLENHFRRQFHFQNSKFFASGSNSSAITYWCLQRFTNTFKSKDVSGMDSRYFHVLLAKAIEIIFYPIRHIEDYVYFTQRIQGIFAARLFSADDFWSAFEAFTNGQLPTGHNFTLLLNSLVCLVIVTLVEWLSHEEFDLIFTGDDHTSPNDSNLFDFNYDFVTRQMGFVTTSRDTNFEETEFCSMRVYKCHPIDVAAKLKSPHGNSTIFFQLQYMFDWECFRSLKCLNYSTTNPVPIQKYMPQFLKSISFHASVPLFSTHYHHLKSIFGCADELAIWYKRKFPEHAFKTQFTNHWQLDETWWKDRMKIRYASDMDFYTWALENTPKDVRIDQFMNLSTGVENINTIITTSPGIATELKRLHRRSLQFRNKKFSRLDFSQSTAQLNHRLQRLIQ